MRSTYRSIAILIIAMAGIVMASSRLRADTGACGGTNITLPFTDVEGSPFFCQIAEAFLSGLTNGSSATTYGPSANVTRDQMAAFVTRGQDSALQRGSRLAALDQFWTPGSADSLGLTLVGIQPFLVESDGADLWVANSGSNSVSRVRASDGSPMGTWTGATSATGVLVAMGKVFVTGFTSPGNLYEIDPPASPGAVTTLSSLGAFPGGIAFDGASIWTANRGGSVSKVTLVPPFIELTTLTAGFSSPQGILFDGSNVWVTDIGDNKLKKLDPSGNILQAVNTGTGPGLPVFDGTNIWSPNGDNTVTVVRATGGLSGTVLATLGGNGLNGPFQAAFDGQRILVTNHLGSTVSLWRASDLTSLGSFSTSPGFPYGVCSDGLNFWLTLHVSNQLARF